MSDETKVAETTETKTAATAETKSAETATPAFMDSICDSQGNLKEGWTGAFKDDIGDSKYCQNFKHVKDVVKSMMSGARLAGRALIPKADDPPEAWDKVWQAAGLPKDGESYGLKLETADKDLAEMMEKRQMVPRMERILGRADVPTLLAPKILQSSLEETANDLHKFQTESAKIRKEVIEARWAGKTTWDDAVKNGRRAMALLYDHTNEVPSQEMQMLFSLLESVGLTDHPLLVGLMERMHTRMTPGKFVVSAAKTGPGFRGTPTYGSVMAPDTHAILAAMEGKQR